MQIIGLTTTGININASPKCDIEVEKQVIEKYIRHDTMYIKFKTFKIKQYILYGCIIIINCKQQENFQPEMGPHTQVFS